MKSANTAKQRLLLVDDDALITESLAFVLGDAFQICTASSRDGALALISRGEPIALALVDLGLPPNPHSPVEGLALISDLLAASPATRIVVLSGQSDESNARLARTLGATDFVAKPVAPDKLRALLIGISTLRDESKSDGYLVGRSEPIVQLKLRLKQFAASHFPVLIEGESGTGKELAARAVHRDSPRATHPYLALNCAAISPALVEATLFGHGRGAFTGAHSSNSGYFEDAREGTLFLDEIGEMPLDVQPKLLRVLENGEFQRIGETHTRKSNARIIAATNRDLREEVRAGRFRADLYHRLSVFTVHMPPLRDLGDDYKVLLCSFFDEYARQTKSSPPSLSDAAWITLQNYSFPGNVRELRNIAIRLTAKYSGREISPLELENELDLDADTANSVPLRPESRPAGIPDARMNLIDSASATLLSRPDFKLDDELRTLESAFIAAAQNISNGNISHAARLLGLSRTTLYNRIESIARDQRKEI